MKSICLLLSLSESSFFSHFQVKELSKVQFLPIFKGLRKIEEKSQKYLRRLAINQILIHYKYLKYSQLYKFLNSLIFIGSPDSCVNMGLSGCFGV